MWCCDCKVQIVLIGSRIVCVKIPPNRELSVPIGRSGPSSSSHTQCGWNIEISFFKKNCVGDMATIYKTPELSLEFYYSGSNVSREHNIHMILFHFLNSMPIGPTIIYESSNLNYRFSSQLQHLSKNTRSLLQGSNYPSPSLPEP